MATKAKTLDDREAVKDYLQRYHMAKERKRILERRHADLTRELEEPTAGGGYRTMPSSKGGKRTEGAVSVVFRLAEVEERIEQQRQDMGKTLLEVMDLVDLLPPNAMERTVVELRHIDCLKWEQICREIHMSRSSVTDYYTRGLAKIMQNKRAKMRVKSYCDGTK